jgi:hypothetical protein
MNTKKLYFTEAIMKKAAVILATAIAFGSGVPMRPVIAATGIDKGIVSAEYIVVSATVEAIDYERRTITLKGPGDKTVTLMASKKIKYLDEIKKGDLVSAEYLDTVAVIVRKPDGKSRPGYLKEVTVAPRGKSSDGLPVDTVELLGTVDAIDHDNRMVTFKGTDGVVQTYKVDERVARFKYIVKGDKIYIKATEPLAIRIKPVEK